MTTATEITPRRDSDTVHGLVGLLASDALRHYRAAHGAMCKRGAWLARAEIEAHIEAGETAYLRAAQLRRVETNAEGGEYGLPPDSHPLVGGS